MARAGRTQHKLIAPIAAACLLAALPAEALAAGGGGSAPSGGAGMAGSGAPAGTGMHAQPAEFPVSASGNGITIQTLSSGSTANALTFTGTVPAADTGRTVELERQARSGTSPTWTPIATTTVVLGGSFSATWRSRRSGRFQVEAVLLPPSQTAASDSASTGPDPVATAPSTAPSSSGAVAPSAGTRPARTQPSSPAVTVDIFQSAVATLYGPGFYGHKTACGQTLRRGTVGVASRTLRCGAKVGILYRGRMLVARVIDRGPFANGAAWDLTMATARALGISGTTTIGALAIDGR